MTTTATVPSVEAHRGRWVKLRAWGGIEVFVSDEEIDLALAHSRNGKGSELCRRIAAENIAIGKRCGAYEKPAKVQKIRW